MAFAAATGEFVLIVDGDGQHRPEDARRIVGRLGDYDLVIGARSTSTQATHARRYGNGALNRLASYLTDRHIPDLTSGFRAARREHLREFIHLLPNGFSTPTTTTLAFIKAGYNVAFEPVEARARVGQSKIRLARDGTKFLVIILKIVTLFSPLRVFLPIGLVSFILGSGYGLWGVVVELEDSQRGRAAHHVFRDRVSRRSRLGTDRGAALRGTPVSSRMDGRRSTAADHSRPPASRFILRLAFAFRLLDRQAPHTRRARVPRTGGKPLERPRVHVSRQRRHWNEPAVWARARVSRISGDLPRGRHAPQSAPMVIKIAQSVLGAIGVLLIASIARRAAGNRGGVISPPGSRPSIRRLSGCRRMS